MKLYFIRHGQTDWNVIRRLQGQVEIPLNEFGEELARKTGEGLKCIPFAVCYTSPLSRAKHTAELILEGRGVKIIEDSRLLEMSFGIYEGRDLTDTEDEGLKNYREGFNHPEKYIAPEGGETYQALMKRTKDFLDELVNIPDYQDKNIMISTHGVALASLLTIIKGNPLEDFWQVGVHKNCGVTCVEVTEGKYQILFENQVYYEDEVEDWHV